MKTQKRIAVVTINRKERETFQGVILKETDSHYYVQHGLNPELGEWFAKESRMVNSTTAGE